MSDVHLVDDPAAMRDGLRAARRIAGYPAVPALYRLQPTVLLLDPYLAQRTGFELLEQLRKRKRAARTNLLTMWTQPRHVAAAMRLGAHG